MQAASSFYGCPKCRWRRSGCIWWRCNPIKYQIHRAKHPEKYGDAVADRPNKELKPEVEKKMEILEFTGDGLDCLPEEEKKEDIIIADID